MLLALYRRVLVGAIVYPKGVPDAKLRAGARSSAG
jgi:hypothetical protein